MLASIVLSTMPIDLRELVEERLVRRVEPLERRQLQHGLTWPSNTTGSTMMF